MKKTITLSLLIFFFLPTIQIEAQKKPKNIVFMIGDGMGLAHVYAAMVSNGNKLELERCKNIGFSKTFSANNFTTDSGAGGTALACGVKTKNGMIGMNADSIPAESILELAEKNKLATGLVAACAITHATPASFIAHQVNRNMYEEIAADFLKTDIDVFIGGGRKNFEVRADGRNLSNELKTKNYQIAYTLDEVLTAKNGKLAGLLSENHSPAMPERGDMLPESTMKAIDLLDNNKKGFFLMVEGSQIDWASHDNNADLLVKEVLDFDKTVGKVLDYAKKHGNTLVIITADHETGGLTLPKGNIKEKQIKANFSTKDHSGIVVPIYSYGPGSEKFQGFMDNTAMKEKMETLLNLKK
jgi:alkaline phosphatase